MKKIIKNKNFNVQILSIFLTISASSVLTYLWLPDIFLMGNYFLIRSLILLISIISLFVLYGYWMLSSLSKKYPRIKLLGMNLLQFIIELVSYIGVFTVLIHFKILSIDIYSFVLFFIVIILSILQKISRFSLLVDAYNENQGENFKSLLLEVRGENKPIASNSFICIIIMFLPLSLFINTQLGISLSIIIGGLILQQIFEILLAFLNNEK